MDKPNPTLQAMGHPGQSGPGRYAVRTDAAPAPVGPYSQGIVASGSFIFTAGQVGLDPKTGKLVGDDITSQTHQALQNLQAVLAAGGTTLSNVVKTTVFLTDMNDFAAMNKVYQEYFSTDPAPARSCVQVARLPLNALVEIEAIAWHP